MVELPKNEAELQALIDEKVKEATKNTITKEQHDKEFSNQRKSYEDKIKGLEEKLGVSAEEKAKELAAQKEKEVAEELTRLRAFEKTTILKEKLTKEGLPTFLSNDSRLINANESDLDKTIKTVKEEWNANLPKGNTHSTVVQVNTNPNGGAKEDDKGVGEFAEVLKGLSQ